MQDNEGKTQDRRPLVVAIVLGALAALLVIVYLGNDSTPVTPPVDTSVTSIVVAAQPIPAGARITAEMVQLRELPRVAVSEGTFAQAERVVGQTSRYPIERGEQITEQRLVRGSRSGALSFQIPPGMRGMSIPVSTTMSPAVLLAPGDFIDLIITGEAQNLLPPATGRSPTATVALTLLQNIQVLSVDRTFVDNGIVYDESVRGQPVEGRQGVSFVTIAVTPDQAQIIALAQEESTTVTFVLRAFGDDAVAPLQPRVQPVTQP